MAEVSDETQEEVARIGQHWEPNYSPAQLLGRGWKVRPCILIKSGTTSTIMDVVGAESNAQACRHAKAAERAGASALMATPPCLTKCAPEKLEFYYQSLLDATSLPLIIQDASNYVGNAIPIATQARIYLAAPERIMFKPEAQPLAQNLSRLRDATGAAAPIFEGSGGLALLDAYHRGIVGTMPGADVPWAIVALWRTLKTDNLSLAGRIHAHLVALVSLMHNLDAYLAIEKFLLVEQEIFLSGACREPVGYELNKETCADVRRLFGTLKEVCQRS